MGPIILNHDSSLFTNTQCTTPEPFSNMQPQAGLAPDIDGLFDLVQPEHRPSNNFKGAGSMADGFVNLRAVSFYQHSLAVVRRQTSSIKQHFQ